MRPVPAVLLACALTLAGLGVAACEPRTVTDTTRQVYCEVMPEAPSRDDDDNPTKVVGSVRFRCDQPGASAVSLTLRLQRQNNAGSWVDVATTAFTAAGDETISTREETFRSRQVTAQCAEGVFRTFVKGTIEARGATRAYEQIGARTFDPCRPGIFAGDESGR